MPRKTTRKSSSEITATRAEYEKVKRVYHKAGKAAFGKPTNSTAKKEYKAVKAVYRRVGNKLGRLTGIK
jgi:hypothetical protein